MVYPDERKKSLMRKVALVKNRLELMQNHLDKFAKDLSDCDPIVDSKAYYDTKNLFTRIYSRLYSVTSMTGSLHI